MKIQDLKFDTRGNKKQQYALSVLLDQTKKIKEVGYGGGAGGAKSYTGVFWVWLMCQKFSGISAFFGRKELKNLKRTTLNTYYKFLGDYNIPKKYQGTLNNQDGVINFENGSKIYLLDLSHQPSDPLYLRFGSLELTIGFIDESNEINYSCIDILKTRVGRQKNKEYGIVSRILETFNPDKGHVYRRFFLPHKKGEETDYCIFIPALATDNKYLSDDYIENLKNADPITRERLLYGNFEYDDTPGKLFDFNALTDMWSNIKTNGIKYITGDIARYGKDKTVLYVWDGWELIDLVQLNISSIVDTVEAIKRLKEKYKVPMSNIVVDEDGIGGGVVDFLECRGFINNSRAISPKSTLPDFKRNYINLKTQCYFGIAQKVNNREIKVSVSGIKENLIRELEVVCQIDLDKDGPLKINSKENIKEMIGNSPDYADAFMMRYFFELYYNGETEGEYRYTGPAINPYKKNNEHIESFNPFKDLGFEEIVVNNIEDDNVSPY